MKEKIPYSDLTQHPPRSFHVRLGGYVGLPRMLDKGRATLVEKNGEYKYNSYTDQHLPPKPSWNKDTLTCSPSADPLPRIRIYPSNQSLRPLCLLGRDGERI